MSDEVWITLGKVHCDFVDPIARRQLEIAIQRGAADEGRPYAERLRSSIDGLRGEAATRVYFGTSIPWSINYLITEGPFEARLDFSDFIDVKTRSKAHHKMYVKNGDGFDRDRAYLLVCATYHPRYRIIGWCWGHELATKDRWYSARPDRDPCWWIAESDTIIKPPHLLRELALAKCCQREVKLG